MVHKSSKIYRGWVILLLATIITGAGVFSTPQAAESAGDVQANLAAKAKPTIIITSIPPYGGYGEMLGTIAGIDPAQYAVAVYIKVHGGWWTKPYWARPVTYPTANGSWACAVTTGGDDAHASDYAAYLIPRSYKPPLMRGAHSLPAALKRNAVAKDMIHRGLRK